MRIAAASSFVLVLAAVLPVPTATAVDASAGSVPHCVAAQLDLRTVDRISEATGQHTLDLKLRDRSGRCWMFGYPRVSLVDHGRVLPFQVRHVRDQEIGNVTAVRVVLSRRRAAATGNR